LSRLETLLDLGQKIQELKLPKSSIGWCLEELESITDEERIPDSDDESEDEIEQMTPSIL
jgi:hypothetical protein